MIWHPSSLLGTSIVKLICESEYQLKFSVITLSWVYPSVLIRNVAFKISHAIEVLCNCTLSGTQYLSIYGYHHALNIMAEHWYNLCSTVSSLNDTNNYLLPSYLLNTILMCRLEREVPYGVLSHIIHSSSITAYDEIYRLINISFNTVIDVSTSCSDAKQSSKQILLVQWPW